MSDINEVIRPFGTDGKNTVSLSATATTGNVALLNASDTGTGAQQTGGGPQQVLIYNQGPNDAFVEFGTGNGASSIAATLPNGATAGSMPVPAKAMIVVSVPGIRAKYAAGICAATQTAVLFFTAGKGS